MRKNFIYAAYGNIIKGTQVFMGYSGTFYMPTRTDITPILFCNIFLFFSSPKLARFKEQNPSGCLFIIIQINGFSLSGLSQIHIGKEPVIG